MNEPKIKVPVVYVLTDGCYSDYRIVGAALNREDADRLAAAFGWDVEEIPCNAAYYKADFALWNVMMRRDGSVEKCQPVAEREPWSSFGKIYYGGEDVVHLICLVWARSAEHAVKIVNERRAALLAADAWGDEEAAARMFGGAK